MGHVVGGAGGLEHSKLDLHSRLSIGDWTHVGVHHAQSPKFDVIRMDQQRFAECLEYKPVSKARRACSEEAMTDHEQSEFKSGTASQAWLLKTRMDVIGEVNGLQTKFSSGTVKDLTAMNSLTRYVKDTSDTALVFVGLPDKEGRVLLLADAAKGDNTER